MDNNTSVMFRMLLKHYGNTQRYHYSSNVTICLSQLIHYHRERNILDNSNRHIEKVEHVTRI